MGKYAWEISSKVLKNINSYVLLKKNYKNGIYRNKSIRKNFYKKSMKVFHWKNERKTRFHEVFKEDVDFIISGV